MQGRIRRRWTGMLVAAVLGAALTAGQPVGAQPAGGPEPDRIGEVALTPEVYAKVIDAVKALGLNELAERLQSQDKNVRLEAIRSMVDRLRDRGGPGRQGEGFGRGEIGPNQGFDLGGLMRGAFAMMPGLTQLFQPVIATTDKYLLVVRGDRVLQLDLNTLQTLNQTQLPQAEMVRPFAQPAAPGEHPRPRRKVGTGRSSLAPYRAARSGGQERRQVGKEELPASVRCRLEQHFAIVPTPHRVAVKAEHRVRVG